MSSAATITVPHLGTSTIGYKLGKDHDASLPTLSAMGTRSARGVGDGPPDLVRRVNTVATQIHRVRLRRSGAGAAVHGVGQPLAFS